MEKINELAVAANAENILAISPNQVVIYNKNIYSYDIAEQKLLWEHKADNGEYQLSACQLHSNLLYASFNHYRSGYADMHDQRLIIIDTQSGNIIWKASIASNNNSYYCVNNNLIYCLNSYENRLYCFDSNKSDDNLLWEQELKIKVAKDFKGEYMSGMKKYKPRILSCFIWDDFLVVTSDANQWLYINPVTGVVERIIELTHDLIGKQQMYPIADRPFVIHNNAVAFIYRGVLCRVNLDSGKTDAYATSYNGKYQNKMASKDNFWGNYDRDVFLSDNKFYFDNDTTIAGAFFEIPVDSTDGVITRKVEFNDKLRYLNTKRVKVYGNSLYINKSCISEGIICYNLETGVTSRIDGNNFNDFTMVNDLLFIVTDNTVLTYK